MRCGVTRILTIAIIDLLVLTTTGASTRRATLMDAIIGDLDRRDSILTGLVNDSRTMREHVAGSLSLEVDGPLLFEAALRGPSTVELLDVTDEGSLRQHELPDGDPSADSLESIKRVVHEAIRGSGRYPADPPAAGPLDAVLLGESRIIRMMSSYPALVVSETEEREALRIEVWVCPDRLTALALFWFRRGNPLHEEDTRLAELKDFSSVQGLFHTLDAMDSPGELAYWMRAGAFYSVPLERGDPRAGGDRMGFLRRNVVVEASSWTYQRPSPQGQWKTVGMTTTDVREIKALLGTLDLSLTGRR
jgi:hypothetical protein